MSIAGNVLESVGTGDVVGPASSTDSALAVFNSTTGKLLKNSVLINTNGTNLTIPGSLLIGPTGPAERLTIGGGHILLDNTYGLKIKNAAGTAVNIVNLTSSDNLNITGPPGGDINVVSSSTLAVKSTGNLIIGSSTSGGSKLSIAGNLAVGSIFKSALAPTDGAIIEGKLGIGTNAPAVRLQVTADNSTRIIFQVGTTNLPQLLEFSTNGNLMVQGSIATFRSNLVASAAITVGASAFLWTNTVANTGLTNNIFVYVDSSTATSVTTVGKNGQQIFASLSASGATVPLKPNEYLTLTYTGTAPTARWEPW